MIYLLDFTYQGLPYRWIRTTEGGALKARKDLHGTGITSTVLSMVPDDTPWEDLLSPAVPSPPDNDGRLTALGSDT